MNTATNRMVKDSKLNSKKEMSIYAESYKFQTDKEKQT